MKTTSLIQASANVVRITSLEVGNVIKILEKEYGDTYKTQYGLVTSLENTGDKSFVTICLYEKSYNEVRATFKTYSGEADLNIFPTTVEEVEEHFEYALKNLETEIEKKKDELFKMKKSLNVAKEFVSLETSKKLTQASFKEIPQKEYRELKESNTVF